MQTTSSKPVADQIENKNEAKVEKVEQVDEDGEDSDGNYDDDEFDA